MLTFPCPGCRQTFQVQDAPPGKQTRCPRCGQVVAVLTPAADRNLLFGILALQMDFIGRDALIAAMHAWVLDKAKPLGQILCEQGALSAERLALLNALLQEHLKQHGNDPGRSLAALSSVGSVRRDLQQVADADVQASLAHVSAGRNGDDPFATRATTAGTPTSSGLRYSILRPHAKGGLGEVFVARDEELRREVALKEIQDRHADHPESRARFLLEAEVTGGLEHPGIVPVYGLGHYGDGRPFYAMRFIRGDSLQDAIRRFHEADKDPSRDRGQRALELRQLLGRFVDVCQAIAYAHSRGVLHRDLKPGNVMLGQYGETLVVDWGLAKALGRPEGGTGSLDQGPLQPASGSTSLPTQMGSALGTPAYMSPEQAAGRLDLLGAASDVYSLGATLYALLTGRVPFEGNDAGAVLQRVQRGDFPPPRQVNNRVPLALDAICRKAMALRPEDRYASAQALADDVEHWLADEPVAAYPEPWAVRAGRWARRHRTAVTGAVAAVAVGAACLTVATLLLADANQREQQAKQKAEQKEQDATAAFGREKEAKQAVQKALTDLEARQSQLARSFCEVSDREFRSGNVQDSLNWMLRAYEVAPSDDSARAGYRQLLAAQGHSVGRPWCFEGQVEAVAFSPDGRLALAGGWDNTTRLWDVATGKPVATLRHSSWVKAVAFSPDGRLVLTGIGGLTGNGESAQLWEAATGKPVAALHDEESVSVEAVAFSPDSRLALTGSEYRTEDGTFRGRARLWEAPTGKLIATLLHDDKVHAVAFSPDGRLALTGSGNIPGDKGEARLWEVATGKPVATLPHGGAVQAVAFSSDGKLALTGSEDRTARLWEAATGKPVATLRHEYSVRAVAFSPDGRLVLTNGGDKAARLWEAATGRPLATLRHEHNVLAVAFSPDGRLALTGSMDNTARFWEAATGKPVATFRHSSWVGAVAFSPDGSLALTGSKDNTARLWEVSGGEPLAQPLRNEGPVTAVAFSPDGRLALTGSGNHNKSSSGARVWEVTTGRPVAALRQIGPVEAVAFSPDGRLALTGSAPFVWLLDVAPPAAQLWEAATGKPVGQPLPHEGPVRAVAFSPDGRLALTGSGDGKARLWEMATSKLVATLRHDKALGPGGKEVWTVAFSPDGRLALTGGGDKTARLWEASTGKPVAIVRHEKPVKAVAFSPDGRLALTASGDEWKGEARLWEVATGKPVATLPHGGAVQAVAFSSDGKLALTGSKDRTAQLWEVATGKPVGPPLRHADFVKAVAFSPDGRLVLTGSNDHTARLWEVATGKELATLSHKDGVVAVAFSPDGRLALTGSNSDTARLWEVGPPAPDEPRRLSAWVHVRTGKTFNEQGILQELSQQDWLRAWQELDANGGDWQPPPDPRRWHLAQAADAEAAKNWFAAAFHLDRLLKMAPEDSDLRRRLDAARAHLRK